MIKLARLSAIAASTLLVMAVSARSTAPSAAPSNMEGPRYDGVGRLILPRDYREWVFLSAGLDMNYQKSGAMPTGHVFGNVFAPRSAYRRFKATGHWPDKTVLIVENRAGSTVSSINRSGQFQTGVLGVEAHVRDVARFKGGWGFFVFDGGRPAARIGYDASCYSCHLANAAVDTTFVQFYPTLLPIAVARGSLSPLHRVDPLAFSR